MRGLDRDVAVEVEQRLLPARERAPEDEHDPLRLRVDRLQDGVRERLPTLAGVRARLSRAHGERSVEQQHSLRGPRFEVAVCGDVEPEVVTQLLADVDE